MRRVVPSPAPISILQSEIIRDLLAAGGVPICAGGGGIPVCRDANGRLAGVEAVIDKDWTSARLAVELQADKLVLLTDIDAVYANWGKPDATPIARLSFAETDGLMLPAGSMGPKAAAAAWFAGTTGKTAFIGALSETDDVVGGRAGTRVE